jgi:small neutral amino acid transporter SnatA (MarC family)
MKTRNENLAAQAGPKPTPLALPSLSGYFPPAVAKVIGREKKMREFIGFMIAYVLYLGALWFFLQSADLSIRVIA